MEIRGVGAKGPYDLLVLAIGDAGNNLMGANIDTGGGGVTLRIPANGRVSPCADRAR
jgi:hypothetical protein